MFRKINDKNHHPKLLQHIDSMKISADKDGVCFGYSAMAMQAILLRDTLTFDTRMSLLYELPEAELTAQMHAALVPSSQITNHSKQQFYIDMQAFLNGVALYQNLFLFSYLFKSDAVNLKQSIEKTAALIQPQKIIDRGGLVAADKFYGVYNYPELIPLLKSLKTQLRDSHIDYPVAFLLRSSNHALTLGFDPKINEWLYMEVHEGTTKYPEDVHIADMVNQAFSSNSITAVTVTAYTLGQHADQTRQILAEWKKSQTYIDCHAASMRRIEFADSNQASLLYMAVVNNDVRKLGTLLKSPHVKVNQKTSDGFWPLYYATLYGFTDCVQLLLQHPEIDVDVARDSGLTVLHIAAHSGRMDILVELLKNKKLDVNKSGLDGMTALHYAVQENHIDCVRLLLEHPGIDVEKLNFKKTTAFMVAAARNYLPIAKIIMEKFPETIHTTIEGMSALRIAEVLCNVRMAAMIRSFSSHAHKAAARP